MRKYIRYLPNFISVLRVLITIPFMLHCAHLLSTATPTTAKTILTWILIALTDMIDGKLARALHLNKDRSLRGGTFDEMSDKLCTNQMFIMLACFGKVSWYFVSIMFIRDIFTTIIRWNAPPSIKDAALSGKVKTTIQCSLITVALMPTFQSQANFVLFLSFASVIMSVVSGIAVYIRAENVKDPRWLAGCNGEIGFANWISLTRIALALIVPYIYAAKPFGIYSNPIAAVTLAIALTTDLVDGVVARTRGETTMAGKYLDPLGDKFIFYPAIIGILIASEGTFYVPDINAWTTKVMLGSCIIATALRDFGFIAVFFTKIKGTGIELPAKLPEKTRFATMCALLVSAALILLAPKSTLEFTLLSQFVFLSLIGTGVLSCVTIGTGYYRYQAAKAVLCEQSRIHSILTHR